MASLSAETETVVQAIRRSFSIHMKRTLALTVTLALGSVLAASAQTPAKSTPAPTKVAVIQFQLAVTQTNEFQRDYANLQKKYAPKRAALQAINTQISSMTKQYQAQAATLTSGERASRVEAINDKKRQAQEMAQNDQDDYQADMQQIVTGLAQKVGAVLTAYAHDHGYTVVLDASAQQQEAPVVLYASPTTDITQAIIDAYNAKSGIAAPPPPAPTPAGAKPAAPAPAAH